METVVVAAHRGNVLVSGTMLLLVSVVVAAAVAFVLVRHLRSRHEPHA
jgi:hypothetical protein